MNVGMTITDWSWYVQVEPYRAERGRHSSGCSCSLSLKHTNTQISDKWRNAEESEDGRSLAAECCVTAFVWTDEPVSLGCTISPDPEKFSKCSLTFLRLKPRGAAIKTTIEKLSPSERSMNSCLTSTPKHTSKHFKKQ